jgi:hypothetical protein
MVDCKRSVARTGYMHFACGWSFDAIPLFASCVCPHNNRVKRRDHGKHHPEWSPANAWWHKSDTCILLLARALMRSRTLHLVFSATTTDIIPGRIHMQSLRMPQRVTTQLNSSHPQDPTSPMEPVSLGIGIAGLFQAAMTCFTCVRIAKSSGSDLQTYMVRLVLLHVKLSRWGEAIGLTEEVHDVCSLKTGLTNSPNIETVESVLKQIRALFENAGKTAPDSNDRPGSDTGHYDNLIKGMRNITVHRQRKLDIVEKVKWCLYAKEELAGLVENLDKLISDLCDLFPSSDDITSQLCDEEASQLLDRGRIQPASLTLLEEVTAQQDPKLAEAVERLKAQVSFSITHDLVAEADSVIGDSCVPGQQLQPRQSDVHGVHSAWRSDQ